MEKILIGDEHALDTALLGDVLISILQIMDRLFSIHSQCYFKPSQLELFAFLFSLSTQFSNDFWSTAVHSEWRQCPALSVKWIQKMKITLNIVKLSASNIRIHRFFFFGKNKRENAKRNETFCTTICLMAI